MNSGDSIEKGDLPNIPQLACAIVPSGNCALIFATSHDPPISQLPSTATVCTAPTYLVALICPKSQVPVPHLSTAIVNSGDSSCGRSRSRKVGVSIASKCKHQREIQQYVFRRYHTAKLMHISKLTHFQKYHQTRGPVQVCPGSAACPSLAAYTTSHPHIAARAAIGLPSGCLCL